MADLFIRGSLNILPGKLDEFRALAARMIEVTRERDRRTLAFDTFLNEEAGVWVALERYPNSDAMMEHFDNQDRALMAEVSACVTPGTAEVFGAPSAELYERLRPYSPSIFTALHSL